MAIDFISDYISDMLYDLDPSGSLFPRSSTGDKNKMYNNIASEIEADIKKSEERFENLKRNPGALSPFTVRDFVEKHAIINESKGRVEEKRAEIKKEIDKINSIIINSDKEE